MNTQYSTHKTRIILLAIAGLIMITTTVQADWLSPAFYGDELDRCAVELRTELNTTGVALLRHTVTDIDKVGVWYVFDIQTEMVDNEDAVIREAKTRCKAHRWNERTVIEVINQSLVSDVRLAHVD